MSLYGFEYTQSDWNNDNGSPDDDDRVWCEKCGDEMDTAWDEDTQDHEWVCRNNECPTYNPKYFEVAA